MERLRTESLNLYYNKFQALKNINIAIEEKKITAIIGPSGCGKSTLLRCFNRMNDFIDGVRIEGKVYVDGIDIYNSSLDLTRLRRKVGMVFQRPNPFPLSVYENIAFGLKIHRLASGRKIDEIVEHSLKSVGLWEELKDKLYKSALNLSLEQQQRLCIARVIALKSDIILLDEPCSALDPISTQRIEELLKKLSQAYTIVIVTHNMQQAARVSDFTGFMLLGELIEFDLTEKIFTSPNDKRTEAYITGHFG
ncbi:MAG TPA: phosphate ABC transporter ATP-binding protein [Candidatus Omnitrophica bacterium]|nr:phosphate ABC transporter ATP-binding protein [Candidatus Omnitrophota bacterium]